MTLAGPGGYAPPARQPRRPMTAALRTLESHEKRPRPLLLRVERDGVLRLVALGAGS